MRQQPRKPRLFHSNLEHLLGDFAERVCNILLQYSQAITCQLLVQQKA